MPYQYLAATQQVLEMGEYSSSAKTYLAPLASPKAPEDVDNRDQSVSRLKSRSMNSVPCQGSRMAKGTTQTRRLVYLARRRLKDKQKQKAVARTSNVQGQLLSSAVTARDELESFSQDNIHDIGFNEGKGKMTLNTSISQKYQPKIFQEIVGHKIVVKALCKAVEKKKIAPLYLFYGPNGTGKTSTARIFAMALNCESNFHNRPCRSCKGCSRTLYIMELCSGNRIAGFEKIRTLLQSTSFTHAIPGLKVLIIEECHSFTAEAWDELMSIVEGPYGATLVFILITIDASSIAANISSRCQKFYFPKLKDEDITMKLSKILIHESMGIEMEAMELIVAKSEGSLRDAENILDQLALLGSTLHTSMVQQLVGLVTQNKLLDLLALAVSGDTMNTIRSAKELIECVEPVAFISQLATLVTEILSGTAVPGSSSSAAETSVNKKQQGSRSELRKTHSARLCYALKILVETEKQLRSSTDQTSGIIAAFLDITSDNSCSRMTTGAALPRSQNSSPCSIMTLPSCRCSERMKLHPCEVIKPCRSVKSIDETQKCRGKDAREQSSLASIRDMEKLWKDVLEGIESTHTKNFLSRQVKLASFSVSRTNAIIHMIFRRPEDKLAAQIAEESLTKAIEVAIGCPVTLNMSLEPLTLGDDEKSTNGRGSQLFSHQQITALIPGSVHNKNSGSPTHLTTTARSSPLPDGLQLTKSKSCSTSKSQQPWPSKGRDSNTVQLQQWTTTFENAASEYHPSTVNPERTNLLQAQDFTNTTKTIRANMPRHRWLSLSSIPQSDASVEPYSQDVKYENSNKDGDKTVRKNPKLQKGVSKISKDHRFQNTANLLKSNPTSSCIDICCTRHAQV